MTEELQIQAQPSDQSCTFTVSEPVYPGGSFFFNNANTAENSPLPSQILSLQPIQSVLISEDTIEVTKTGHIDWRPLAAQIGAIIRAAMDGNSPPIDPELASTLPPSAEIQTSINGILESDINPSLASHGGYVELLEVKRNDLYVRMGGGCQGCSSASATLRQGVEQLLRERVPAVGAIFDTTDHAAGRNPYYTG